MLTPQTLNQYSGDPNFMLSLAKGLLVLETSINSSKGRNIAHLSKVTGLSTAAVRRCVYTLSRLGYFGNEIHRASKAIKGPALHSVSGEDEARLKEAAVATLRYLRKRSIECLSITARAGWKVRCLLSSEVPSVPLSDVLFRDVHDPIQSAMGHLLLADLDQQQLAEFFDWSLRASPCWNTAMECKFRKHLDRIRIQGFAFYDGERGGLSRSVACAIRINNTIAATLNATSCNFDENRRLFKARTLAPLQRAAEELTAFVNR